MAKPDRTANVESMAASKLNAKTAILSFETAIM
jgi:hypothetical protein